MKKRQIDDIQVEKSISKRIRTNSMDGTFNDEESVIDETETIFDSVENIFKLPQNQIMNEIKALIKSTLNGQGVETKMSQIFYYLVEIITNNKEVPKESLDDKLVTQITLTLSNQIDSLPFVVIKKIVNLFQIRIKTQKHFNEKCLQLFIDIFNFIQSISAKWASEENESGNDYIDSFIKEIFSFKWTQLTSINIVFVLRHIKLEFSQLKELILKLFNFEEISFTNNQIPSLINNILYFMAMNKDFRIFLFEKIFLFFNEFRNQLSNKSVTTSSQASSEFVHPSSSILSSTTINFTQKSDFIDAEILSIMHILHSIKTDRAVAKDLVKMLKLKMMKNVKEIFYPFTFALALALSKIMPKQDGVIEILKSSIEKIFEAELKANQYNWVFKGLNEDEKNFSKNLLKPSRCKILASEAVLEGFINFLFCLLETNGVRMTKSMKAISLKEHVTFYASDIINDLFKNFPVSREEILNQLTEQIFASNATKSCVFIDQLSILISSHPPSLFQEYFRKFKGKLDHLINLTPIVALELLNSIKPLFRYDSIYKDNLIITLKKSIYQSDVDIRKVGVCGLISLLTTTKLTVFLPASQASQSMNLSQSQSQMSRVTASQEKCIETSCLEIFFSLRRCLTQQAEIRSKLYQSCFNLVTQNITLIGPTLNLLLTKLDEYLIFEDPSIFINLKKCFNFESDQLINLEPIDILIHSVCMCNMKFIEFDSNSKLTDIDEDIKKHSEDLKIYLEQLKDTFLNESVKSTFDLYKKEISNYYANKVTPSATGSVIKSTNATQKLADAKKIPNQQLFLPFQCLLGVVEVLMEYNFFSSNYTVAHQLFKFYVELHKLIEKDLIDSTKPPPKPKKPKKQKENSENENSIEVDEIKAEDSVEDKKLNETTKKASRTVNNAKKFSYTYRLSYTCTLTLFKLIYRGSSYIKKERGDESTEEENFLFQIKNCLDDFKAYLTSVLSQQLDNLINTKSVIYDIESFDQKSLVKYLLSLWKILWNEMNETKCSNNECTDENFYCGKCIQSRSVIIRCLINVWNIVSLKFNSKLNDLFSVELFIANEDISGSNESNHSEIAVGLLDMCRKYVDKCLNSERQVLSNSFKLCSSVLDLMTDIAKTIKINADDYGVIFSWTQTLATQEYANDLAFSKALLKFFIFVTWNKNNSATLMKYLCTDVVHFFDSYDSDYQLEPAVFNFMSEKTSNIILNIIFEEEANILNSFEWFLSYKPKFESNQAAVLFYKQVISLMNSLHSLIVSNLPVGVQENLIRAIIRFYNFMISLSKHVTKISSKLK